MKKAMKTVITLVIVLVLVAAVVVGGVLWYNNSHYIGRDAALSAAAADAGFTVAQVFDTDTDLKLGDGPARYHVEFHAEGGEYEYVVNAVSGEILSGGLDNH
jgi:uncharacterized membrane protein YkoI